MSLLLHSFSGMVPKLQQTKSKKFFILFCVFTSSINANCVGCWLCLQNYAQSLRRQISKATMKKNMAKLVPNFTRQASLLGVFFRIRGKLTIASLIRVLLCAAVCTAFLGNIIFLLETRKMNSESEKNFIDRKNLGRISLRDRDVAGSKMEETTNKGKSLWVWIILNKLVASLMFRYFL